jgi:hypothetical protein
MGVLFACLLPIAYCLLPAGYWLIAYCLLPIGYLPVPQSLHRLLGRLCLQELFGLQSLQSPFFRRLCLQTPRGRFDFV